MLRLGRGTQVEHSRAPARPLELWSFEASPFCRIVREKLCTLELPYRLHNVGKGSAGREAFVERSGRMQVPYLEDPNNGPGPVRVERDRDLPGASLRGEVRGVGGPPQGPRGHFPPDSRTFLSLFVQKRA